MTDSDHEPGPEWLTIAEYAAAMRRTRRTIERWIERGDLPVRRHGRTTRIHRSELEPIDEDDATGSGPTMHPNVLTIRR